MSPAACHSEPTCRPAEAACHAANPPLATLAQALRAPLLPVIGFAQLAAQPATPAETRAWAAEILAGSTALLAVLDCTLALVAGRAPPAAQADTLAAAEDAVAALRCLLQRADDKTATDDCGTSQRRVA